ncbi:MAG: hypothetical protein QOF04_3255, partial [Solirubrobacteraceae bacterium]|nr:hypothetical protein [Solirubrobacteraceae bacterium]
TIGVGVGSVAASGVVPATGVGSAAGGVAAGLSATVDGWAVEGVGSGAAVAAGLAGVGSGAAVAAGLAGVGSGAAVAAGLAGAGSGAAGVAAGAAGVGAGAELLVGVAPATSAAPAADVAAVPASGVAALAAVASMATIRSARSVARSARSRARQGAPSAEDFVHPLLRALPGIGKVAGPSGRLWGTFGEKGPREQGVKQARLRKTRPSVRPPLSGDRRVPRRAATRAIGAPGPARTATRRPRRLDVSQSARTRSTASMAQARGSGRWSVIRCLGERGRASRAVTIGAGRRAAAAAQGRQGAPMRPVSRFGQGSSRAEGRIPFEGLVSTAARGFPWGGFAVCSDGRSARWARVGEPGCA